MFSSLSISFNLPMFSFGQDSIACVS